MLKQSIAKTKLTGLVYMKMVVRSRIDKFRNVKIRSKTESFKQLRRCYSNTICYINFLRIKHQRSKIRYARYAMESTNRLRILTRWRCLFYAQNQKSESAVDTISIFTSKCSTESVDFKNVSSFYGGFTQSKSGASRGV